MSTSGQGGAEETGQRRGVRKINEAVDKAQEQLTLYEHRRAEMNLSEAQFRQTGQHTDAVRELHRVVKYTFEKLRYYIEQHLEDGYWENEDIVWDTILWPDGDEQKEGMQALDDLPEPITYVAVEKQARHGANNVRQQKEVLVPYSAYERMVRLLDECRGELGFGPNASKSTTRTEISKELMDEYDEWAQKMREQTDYEQLDEDLQNI